MPLAIIDHLSDSMSSYSYSSSKSRSFSFGSQSSYPTSSSTSSSPSPISHLFDGCSFFIDKDSCKTLKERQRIASTIKDHGGSVSLMLSKKTTYFIVALPTETLLAIETSPTSCSHSLIYQLNTAIRQNILVVPLDFVYECITRDTIVSEYIIPFKKEIRMVAEISIDDLMTVTVSCDTESIVAIEPDVTTPPVLDVDVDPIADSVAVATPMVTMAYCPKILASPIPFTFIPEVFMEKDVTCKLMSHMEPFGTDGLTMSFEESRFYTGSRSETILGIPDRPQSSNGSIWSWGQGAKGQLGCGEKKKNLFPTFISDDFLGTVKQVTCGNLHSAALSADGSVWTWGSGASGALGHGDRSNLWYPTFVDCFTDIKITMIACGRAHTTALTDCGTLWAWGDNNYTQLGFDSGHELISSPTEVFSVKHAVFVACGGNNTAVVDKYGDLHTMGCNVYGQRGIGAKRKAIVAFPTKLTFPAKTKIKYVDIGQGFMGALSLTGELYTWGRNLQNQCGNGTADDIFTPQKIEVGIEIIHLSCGDTHTALVTTNGDVYTFGWGPVGQLGHTEDMPTCTIPTHVESVSDVCMVACGSKHTIALSDKHGKVWVWGSNECGQSGIPFYESFDYESDEEESSEAVDVTTWLSPQIIESLSRVSLVACGKDFTLAIVEQTYVPIQFAKDGNDDELFSWLEDNPDLRDLDDTALRAIIDNIRYDEHGIDFSLLHWATINNRANVLELLVGQKWASPNVTDANGDTPLHLCAEHDLPDCAAVLLQRGAKPDQKNKSGKTAIHVSVENRTVEVLREFVQNSTSNKSIVDETGNTPLHTAIKLRHFEMAEYLIEHAAQPQILDKSGKTALDYCSFKEASYFKSLAQKNDVFISYAHVDVVFATKVKEFLELHSIKCWMDMTRLEAGNDWRLDIGTGLLSSRLVLFIGSRASVVSDWCIKELHMAKKHNRVIIPIWFQKVEFDSEVKSLLFGRGFLDFTKSAFFSSQGNRLAKKLKYVLGIVKSSKPNPYLEIPNLTKDQLWKQLFLTIMLESYTYYASGCKLEATLHNSAIFTCTHTIESSDNLDHLSSRADNLEHSWGIVFLVSDLKRTKDDLEKWWRFADAQKKRVYLCMTHGDASNVAKEDLPVQALAMALVPIFYLQSEASIQQLIYFVHLAQREEFMAKQVVLMEDKRTITATTIDSNEAELVSLKKRYYVE